MQHVAEGSSFGPITDKLVRDLLNAGVRLTTEVSDHPEQLGPRLHAYTVEITTALALAISKLEAEQDEPPADPKRRPRRPSNGHLSVVRTEDD
jgi:hypothetical protein